MEEKVIFDFREVLSQLPHGELEELLEWHRRAREELGRDWVAAALLMGGWPPKLLPFTTARDHRVAACAASLTYPEDLWPEFWRLIRKMGRAQALALAPRDFLRMLEATRSFSPRARRWVRGTGLEYIGRLLADRARWEAQVLSDSDSLLKLVHAVRAPVPRKFYLVLVKKSAWEDSSWPRLSAWRRFQRALGQRDFPSASRAILAGRLPLLRVEGVVDLSRAPGELLRAALSSATPGQVIRRLERLARAGRLGEMRVKEAVLASIERAGGDPRVAPADLRRAAVLAQIPEEVREALRLAEERARERLRARRAKAIRTAPGRVCLIVDTSGSMEACIVASRQLAAYLADQGAEVVALRFDSHAAPIIPPLREGRQLWEAAFSGLRAHGWTCIRAGLEKAGELAAEADCWVLLSDGQETRGPYIEEDWLPPNPPLRLVMMWFGERDDPEVRPAFRSWLCAMGAEEFDGRMREGRLDYAALDDLAAVVLAGDALREWVGALPLEALELLSPKIT
jgi:Mg-chelatase subunit ChlD